MISAVVVEKLRQQFPLCRYSPFGPFANERGMLLSLKSVPQGRKPVRFLDETGKSGTDEFGGHLLFVIAT